MLLRNHGAVCCGETIEEAFFYAYHLVLACDTQLKMAPMGLDNLVQIDDDTRRKVWETAQRGGGGVNSATEGGPDGTGDKKRRSWGVGEMEFEALMRWLDNAVSQYREFSVVTTWIPHCQNFLYRDIAPATSTKTPW